MFSVFLHLLKCPYNLSCTYCSNMVDNLILWAIVGPSLLVCNLTPASARGVVLPVVGLHWPIGWPACVPRACPRPSGTASICACGSVSSVWGFPAYFHSVCPLPLVPDEFLFGFQTLYLQTCLKKCVEASEPSSGITRSICGNEGGSGLSCSRQPLRV